MSDWRDDDRPESWKPEEAGESIEGVFLRLERGPDMGYGKPYIAVLETEQGLRSVWLFGQVLWNEFCAIEPQPGERILVRYKGERKTKDGKRTFKAWSVKAERAAPATVDWARLGGGTDLPEEASGWSDLPGDAVKEPAGGGGDEDIPF